MRRLLACLTGTAALLSIHAQALGAGAEEEEAARIQIATGSSAGIETLAIFNGKDASLSKLRADAWLSCKISEAALPGGKAIEMRGGSPAQAWGGFRLIADKASPMTVDRAQDLDGSVLLFRVKPEGNADLKELQVCVCGKGPDGKPEQSRWLPIVRAKGAKGEWAELSFKIKEFPEAEKLRNLCGAGFQFMGAAPDGAFLFDSIRIERKASKTSQTSFKIEDFDLGGMELSTEKFPASATNIRIAGSNFVRDGRPVFLTGVEDDAIDFPWLYKLLGFDVAQIQDFSPETLMDVKMSKGSAEVAWRPASEWIDTKVRILLSNGLAVHVNYWDGAPSGKEFKEVFADALAETSHFYGFRLDHPLGRKIKESYTRDTLKTLGKYPITFYELYNELYYGDASPMAVEAFQKEMKAKYGEIEKANKALKCSFKSFDTLTPPRKKVNWMVTKNELAPQDVSPELYAEWQSFVERWLGAQLMALTANVKKDIKFPGSYVIYQATMGLHEDFSGFTGTNPYELVKAEDALCHEGGMHFTAQDKGAENVESIAKMARSMMVWDLLKGISPDKPVYLSECSVGSYSLPFDKSEALLSLGGDWKFADDSEGKGAQLGFQGAAFDDSAWPSIKAPGVWGEQGFPKCTRGWLRRSFDAPEGKTGKLFITGRELADFAKIYLNGKLIHESSAWNESFSVDVSGLVKPKGNVLALCIANSYEVGGKVQGGIRDFLAVTDRQFFKAPKLTAGQMRSWFWSMAVHDVSGVIMSYFYTPATNKDVSSIYSPITRDYDAIKAIPEVKNEIDSVAGTLLPRPRVKGELAVVYPFETGRARVLDSTKEMFSGKITLSMMDYYLSALFSQRAPEVTSCKDILEGKADKFKTIVLAASPRVPSGLSEKLESYVANGGVLILDANSMSFDDGAHAPIPTPAWLGIKTGAAIDKAKRASSDALKLNNVETEQRAFDKSYGVDIELDGAEAIACFEDGKPAIAAASHGKGHVYYFACKLPFKQLKSSIAAILAKHGVAQQTVIRPLNGEEADFIESHVIGSKDSFVWYLNNFGGGDVKLKASWPGAPEGSYKLTDIRSGKTLAEKISSEKLKGGIELCAASQDPVTLLLERAGSGAAAEIKPLSAERKLFLDMWGQSPQGEVKVLFNSCNRDEIDPFRMLTGKKMLEDAGFETSYARDTPKDGFVKTYLAKEDIQPLANFQIYALPGSRVRDEAAIKSIEEYVRNGGSVLLSATANFGYFGWMSNAWNRKKLFDAFGLRCTDNNFKDESASVFSPYFCKFSNVAQGHPLTIGVESVQIAGATEIQSLGKGQDVLVRSNASSTPKEAPFLIAFEHGKGRVVAMGDAQWLEPEWLDKADNAQLMLNIFNWLARKETKALPKEQLKAMSNSAF